jgi:capsular polysaccharide biosynthesis protein
MTCNLDNYCHWMLEAVARFSAAELRGYGVLAGAPPDMILAIPPLDAAWKRESLALALPRDIRPTPLTAGSATPVARLLYIPQFADGGLSPHRALLPVFERMRAAAYTSLGAEPAAPWRKLFISRADSANRVLVNEAELATVAAKAGFERVVLAGVPLAEQIRLFTEATRIVGAHGAGLTNLLFCRPGAVVCELHMDCYVQWAFRRLAALRGLRYGCVVGAHIPPRHDWPHRNRFRVDPAEFAAALDC